eukprot:15110024-Heterocapsa_arctica.AAC.1
MASAHAAVQPRIPCAPGPRRIPAQNLRRARLPGTSVCHHGAPFPLIRQPGSASSRASAAGE